MDLAAGYTIRFAVPEDAEVIQAQREAMFKDMGADLHRLSRAHHESLAWHQSALKSGVYTGLLLDWDAEPVAGLGIMWQDFPPSALSVARTRAYILNVFVAEAHRGQGVSGMLMQRAMQECQRRGVEVVSLHASDAGRTTYARAGFHAVTEEMRFMFQVDRK